MKGLKDLHPKFIGTLRPESGEGIQFDCPSCGPSHQLVAYFENPLDGLAVASWTPKWKRIGEEFDVLSIEPSLEYPCWHGWIEEGRAIDVRESPLVLFDQQKRRPVALSPLQTLNIAGAAIAKAKKALRG
jgi:hypothetical protein